MIEAVSKRQQTQSLPDLQSRLRVHHLLLACGDCSDIYFEDIEYLYERIFK